MKIKCQKCNKKISFEMTDGICSKCGYLNRRVHNFTREEVESEQIIPKQTRIYGNDNSIKPIRKQLHTNKQPKRLPRILTIIGIILIVGKPIGNYIIHKIDTMSVEPRVREASQINAKGGYDDNETQILAGEVIVVGNIAIDYIPVENNPELEQNIIIPEGVIEIGEKAFYNISGAKNIIFSSTLKKVSEKAFYGCNDVQESILPEGLEIVEDYVFPGIRFDLDDLPSSLKEIGAYSFDSAKTQPTTNKHSYLTYKQTPIHRQKDIDPNINIKCKYNSCTKVIEASRLFPHPCFSRKQREQSKNIKSLAAFLSMLRQAEGEGDPRRRMKGIQKKRMEG